MAEVIRKVLNQRQKLVDNSLEVGGEMVLGTGLYMRHLPSGRVYPFEVNGAKRDDVEIFKHNAANNTDIKVPKPEKKKPKGPFARRDEGIGAYDVPGQNAEVVA
jgi:hypothetical protein